MEDRYCNDAICAERLYKEYLKYGTLYIAFDFDNTVFDYHKVGDTYPAVEIILKKCKDIGFKLILFTANETNSELSDRVKYCIERGYAPDYVNESPILNSKKPYFNLLLDDRAGLGSAILQITELFKMIGICKQ